MSATNNRQGGAQKMLLGTLAAGLITSLVSSLSINYGHADVPVAATAEEIEPLQEGQPAPRFAVDTVDGEPYDFDPRKLERPAILITFRGGWCPYCNMYLSELRHVLPEISAMDIDVLFLSGDRPDLLFASLGEETRAEIEALDYRLYSDANAAAAIALGIAFRVSDEGLQWLNDKGRDIERSSMDLHGVLPVPAVFAIDADGIIRFAYANADYKVRLPADELMEVATSMAAR